MVRILTLPITNNRFFHMAEKHPGYRIFVLGAGFSIDAGLPLASELFSEVCKLIEQRYG